MNAITTPAFDPDSADATLLAAYEKVRAARAHCYQFDGQPYDAVRDEELSAIELASHADMAVVEGGSASTIEGVRTRLQLLLPSLSETRWVDRNISEHGLLGLYRDRESVDGHTQQVLDAADELLRIEWAQALAAYEKASKNYNLSLLLKEAVEEEDIRQGGLGRSEHLRDLRKLVASFEEAFCDEEQVRRLIRTLAPSHEALSAKLRIAREECLSDYATPWIARDVQFLAGLTARLADEEGER